MICCNPHKKQLKAYCASDAHIFTNRERDHQGRISSQGICDGFVTFSITTFWNPELLFILVRSATQGVLDSFLWGLCFSVFIIWDQLQCKLWHFCARPFVTFLSFFFVISSGKWLQIRVQQATITFTVWWYTNNRYTNRQMEYEFWKELLKIQSSICVIMSSKKSCTWHQ